MGLIKSRRVLITKKRRKKITTKDGGGSKKSNIRKMGEKRREKHNQSGQHLQQEVVAREGGQSCRANASNEKLLFHIFLKGWHSEELLVIETSPDFKHGGEQHVERGITLM